MDNYLLLMENVSKSTDTKQYTTDTCYENKLWPEPSQNSDCCVWEERKKWTVTVWE